MKDALPVRRTSLRNIRARERVRALTFLVNCRMKKALFGTRAGIVGFNVWYNAT